MNMLIEISSATYFEVLDTPIGALTLRCLEHGALCEIVFDTQIDRLRWLETHGRDTRDPQRLRPAREQLREYFAGERTRFELDLAPEGTPFQRSVWREVAAIPHGTACSYGSIAQRVGSPKAARAVGAANGQNPLPIVVPCHRVIGANGTLTGYAGGLPRKGFLLRLENVAGVRTET